MFIILQIFFETSEKFWKLRIPNTIRRFPSFRWGMFSHTTRANKNSAVELAEISILKGLTMNPLNALVSASTIGIKSNMACLRGGISFLICESSASNFLFPYVSQPTMAARAAPCDGNTQDQQNNSPTSDIYINVLRFYMGEFGEMISVVV